MLLTDLYALSSGGTDWTEALRAAAQSLAEAGGKIIVPPGVYNTGSVQLFSNTTLLLTAGATLRFFDDPDCFPLIDGEFEGIPGKIHRACLFADEAENIRIGGNGTIDGNGARWWAAKRANALANPRPYLVHLRNCKHITLEGVQLINSPTWTVHPQYCRNVTLRGLRIINPPDSPNTDGIDPNGCTHVRISDCYIDVGDDCIAIKSGTEDTPNALPCENILITNCTMARGHGGVVIGSEMRGDVRNVVVSACIMQHTDRGIRIKTRRGRGGTVENLRFSDILMNDVACPFVINMYYFCGKDGKTDYVRNKAAAPVTPATPIVRDVQLDGISVRGATACAGFLYGLPESPIRDVSISNVSISMQSGTPGFAAMMDDLPQMEATGFFLRNVQGLGLHALRISGEAGEPMDIDKTVTKDEAGQ